MHNLCAIFAKYLDICKHMADNLVSARGNLSGCGVVLNSAKRVLLN